MFSVSLSHAFTVHIYLIDNEDPKMVFFALKFPRQAENSLDKEGYHAKYSKNSGAFCHVKLYERVCEISSFHLNNGFRLPENTHGYQSLKRTSENAIRHFRNEKETGPSKLSQRLLGLLLGTGESKGRVYLL